MNQYKKFKEIIDDSKSITLFTGAGISVPSGIPDFRSASGLYNQKEKREITPEELISASFFLRNPKDFYEYYKKNLIYKDAKPNIAHLFFAELEKNGKLKAVITQNIDGLHQKAGSQNVLELHGSVERNFCTKCNKFFDVDYILHKNEIPYCDECNSLVKPDVVLYEESLDASVLEKSIKFIENSDCLIIVGTSLIVYPAAGLIRYFKGENIVLINLQKTAYDNIANLVFNEDVIEVIKKISN